MTNLLGIVSNVFLVITSPLWILPALIVFICTDKDARQNFLSGNRFTWSIQDWMWR